MYMRTVLMVFLVLVIGVAAAGAWVWNHYTQFLQTPLSTAGEQEQTLLIEPGTSFRGMVKQLQQMGLTRDDWRWRVLGRLEQPLIKSGEYRLQPGLGIRELLVKLRDHDVTQYAFTIVEGWTTRQLFERLTTVDTLQQTENRYTLLAERLADSPLVQQARSVVADKELPDSNAMEGMFLPETYYFQRNSSDIELLVRAHQALLTAVEQQWQSYLDHHEVAESRQLDDAYELLALASIIEKETGQSGEREQISGVFHRRLKRGMLLQTDPTVIYGIGAAYDGNIRRTDLKTDTPYNTYTRAGLTPTPIALAGLAAISAAAAPASGDTLYFVAKGDGSGGHVFSRNLKEHNRAVQRYLRNNRQRLRQNASSTDNQSQAGQQ